MGGFRHQAVLEDEAADALVGGRLEAEAAPAPRVGLGRARDALRHAVGRLELDGLAVALAVVAAHLHEVLVLVQRKDGARASTTCDRVPLAAALRPAPRPPRRPPPDPPRPPLDRLLLERYHAPARARTPTTSTLLLLLLLLLLLALRLAVAVSVHHRGLVAVRGLLELVGQYPSRSASMAPCLCELMNRCGSRPCRSSPPRCARGSARRRGERPALRSAPRRRGSARRAGPGVHLAQLHRHGLGAREAGNEAIRHRRRGCGGRGSRRPRAAFFDRLLSLPFPPLAVGGRARGEERRRRSRGARTWPAGGRAPPRRSAP